MEIFISAGRLESRVIVDRKAYIQLIQLENEELHGRLE